MKLFKPISVLIAWLLMYSAGAQDIHFSQFYENAILRNPALTGIFSGDYKAGINYRNQWSNISVPFQTGLASVESRISLNEVGDYLSFGATLTYDHAGSINFNSMQVYPAVNYNKALEDEHSSYLSMGFAAGYIQRSFDITKMTFSEQYQNGYFIKENSSGENITNTKLAYYDLATGVSFNSSLGEYNQINYYVGLAAYHINKPKAAFSADEKYLRLNKKWNGNVGVQWIITANAAVTFHANYSKQGSYQETIMGALASWRHLDEASKSLFKIYGGMFYRFQDALIPTVKLDYSIYSFTVSYDLNNSSLRTASKGMGGFEISIYSRGLLRHEVDKNRCPRFEEMMLPSFEQAE